jgi:hypothetical protein
MAISFGLLMPGFVMVMARRGHQPAPTTGLLLATAAGSAYGCFTALWHCCSPLWELDPLQYPMQMAGFLMLALSPGAVGRFAASIPFPQGELVAALLFGLFYPWHTVSFFIQCMLGGVLFTWMVRQTRNGWAPSLFLATAYVTHMTLPFIGWVGVMLALALLALHGSFLVG